MRRTLTLIAISLGLLAASAATYVAVSSLAPGAAAYAALPRVTLPSLKPGEFAFAPNPVNSDQWPSEYLFVRSEAGQLRVFEIPTHRGRFTMPDRAWWRAGNVCKAFEPDFKAQQFMCLDADANEWMRTKFRWSLDGKSLHPDSVEDMIEIHGRIEAGSFVVGAKPDV